MERKGELETTSVRYPDMREATVYYRRPSAPEVLLRPEVKVRQDRLARVIAGEIVPRLQLFHHQIARTDAVPGAPTPEEIAEFGALAMGPDVGAASLYFDKMRAKGHSLDTLFVHFLAPTARYLGELWEQDRCDFIDVTIGVARLQEFLSIFGATQEAPVTEFHHRALLVTTPGEKHLFGVDMVAKFMRGAGWDVLAAGGVNPKEAAGLVAREWFGVAGVTLSAETGLESAAATIDTIRRSSLNRAIGVMVGGPIFTDRPERALQVGADAAAVDAPTAVLLAKKLLLAQGVST